MNRTHRLVWNSAREAWMAASEHSRGRGKSASPLRRRALAVAVAGVFGTKMALAAPPAPTTLPVGEQVVAGQAAITRAGSAMSVQQSSDKAIVNWQSFSIGADASVNFAQPSASAVALNRVVGQDPSAIYGRLSANGQVFLVNPNGVLFGPGSRVDVGGLVASTMNIRNEDFLAGNYRFTRDGATAGVVNQGELTARYVALLAPEVRNEGAIVASMGTAALAAGDAVTLGITGQNLVSVQVERAAIDTLVENRNLVKVDAGTVVMSAQSANALLGRLVNSGAIEADGIAGDGGTIRLTASSAIEHSGRISVNAGADGHGGQVTLIADLANPASRTDFSGTISARGGAQSGDGGLVETSASRLKIADSARVDTLAPGGRVGQWLLDPYDFTIASANGDITGAALSAALASSNVTIATTDVGASCTGATCGTGSASGNGDIFVNDSVSWTAPTVLKLSAWRDVRINAPINVNSSGGGLALEFAQSADTFSFPSGGYFVNGPVNLAVGTTFSTRLANDGPTVYSTIIRDATALAAMSGNLAGNYVLGADVAAPVTSWTPVGNLATPFTGAFDGLGHKVTGLTHTNASLDTEVGLFGASTGLIQNVGVTGASMEGVSNVGVLAGYSNGFIANSYATGTVRVTNASGADKVGGIGGLVGFSMGPIIQSYANVNVEADLGDQTSGSPADFVLNPANRPTGGIGGLAGFAGTGVNDSYAKGSVRGLNAVGGLVGYTAAGISSSYSTGAVSLSSGSSSNIGGLVGQTDYPGTSQFIFSSFWDTQTSGQALSGASAADDVTGKTTAEMKMASTFVSAGWPASGGWELRDGQYPLLKAMLQPIFVIADNKSTTYNGSPVTGFATSISPATTSGSNYTGTATVTPSTLNPTNAGSYTLTPGGISVADASDQHGYRIEFVNGTLTIAAAPVSVVINGSLVGSTSKVYDGNDVASGLTNANYSLTGWVGADGATVSKTTGTYDNANAGTGKLVTVNLLTSDYTGTGSTNLANYTLPTIVTGNIGAITAKALNVSVSKTYDATDGFTSGFSLTGMVGSEAAPTVTGSASVSSANANTYNSFATNSLVSSNPNYTLAGGTVSAIISPKVLDYSGVSVNASRVYDGSNLADVLSPGGAILLAAEGPGTGTSTDGKPYTGDTVNVTVPALATYNSKDVATASVVTFTGLLSDNPNYTISSTKTQAATITPKLLDYTGLSVAGSRAYDATTGAAVSGTAALLAAEAVNHGLFTATDGKPYTGDTVNITGTAVGTYNSKDVASASLVTLTGLTSSNPNYTISQTQTQAGTITQKALNVSVSKTYDTTAGFTSGFSLTGMAGSEAAPGLTGSASVSSANANTYNSFAASTLALSDPNYTLAGGTVSATISQKVLDVLGLTGSTVNNGSPAGTSVVINGTGTLRGAVTVGSGTATDGAPYDVDLPLALTGTPTGATGAAATGTTVPVTLSGLTLSGGAAGNYRVNNTLTGTSVSAKIEPSRAAPVSTPRPRLSREASESIDATVMANQPSGSEKGATQQQAELSNLVNTTGTGSAAGSPGNSSGGGNGNVATGGLANVSGLTQGLVTPAAGTLLGNTQTGTSASLLPTGTAVPSPLGVDNPPPTSGGSAGNSTTGGSSAAAPTLTGTSASSTPQASAGIQSTQAPVLTSSGGATSGTGTLTGTSASSTPRASAGAAPSGTSSTTTTGTSAGQNIKPSAGGQDALATGKVQPATETIDITATSAGQPNSNPLQIISLDGSTSTLGQRSSTIIGGASGTASPGGTTSNQTQKPASGSTSTLTGTSASSTPQASAGMGTTQAPVLASSAGAASGSGTLTGTSASSTPQASVGAVPSGANSTTITGTSASQEIKPSVGAGIQRSTETRTSRTRRPTKTATPSPTEEDNSPSTSDQNAGNSIVQPTGIGRAWSDVQDSVTIEGPGAVTINPI